MNMWIIAALIVGVLLVAAGTAIAFEGKISDKGCASCGGQCTQGDNCGKASCGAVSGKTCGCNNASA